MQRDLVEEYLKFLQVEKGLSQNSLENYRRDLAKLSEWAQKQQLKIESLTQKDLREFLIDVNRLSPSSINRLISSLRGFYKFLIIDGFVDKNPAENLMFQKKLQKLPEYLSVEDIERLFSVPDVSEWIGLRNRTILELLYACGLRVSELVNLEFSDVDLDTRVLTCYGKGSKVRKIPIGKSAVEWLKKYLPIRREQEIKTNKIFVSASGKPLTRQEVFFFIKEYGKKIGIPNISPHTLRHCFATHLVQNDADLLSVQRMLGHENVSTTQIYTHLRKSDLQRSYEKAHPRANFYLKSSE
jgi:integrase/recombinase XerD